MRKYLLLIISTFLFCSTQSVGQQFKTNFTNPTDSLDRSLLIPNAFTPNNDGTNDAFKIQNFSIQKLIEFKVFNRWGTILYETANAGEGWDGTYHGKPQPMGVYGYVIRIAYPDNIVETYKGTVTLLR